jgi:3-hydroxyacyl-[acyl-carrier-protein] dehydratase
MTDRYIIDAEGIMERLPHRHPFLMIDGITSCKPGKSIVAVKNVAANEPQFTGHFPRHPVMPGVLIVESMAQAGGVLVWESLGPDDRNFILYLVGIEKSRFRRPAYPGDQLILRVELTAQRRVLWRFSATAEVDDKLIASAEFLQAPGKTL